VLAQGLNQVLVLPKGGPETTDRLVGEIQRAGTCWLSATTWRGVRCIHISVCNWQTTFEDVDRSVEAIVGALERTVTEDARAAG
jgi:hypothetical protein